jgi:hypothetical protein
MSDRYLLRRAVTREQEIAAKGPFAKLVGWIPAGKETKKKPAIERVLDVNRFPLGGFVTDSHTGKVVFLTSPAIEKLRGLDWSAT